MSKPGSGMPPGAKAVLRTDKKSRPSLGSVEITAGKTAAHSKLLFAAEASQLLDLFRSGQHDGIRMLDFFAKYPALAAEAIKRSNSAVFHRSLRTTDIENAMLRLGDFELYDIVFTALAKQRSP